MYHMNQICKKRNRAQWPAKSKNREMRQRLLKSKRLSDNATAAGK